MAQQQMQKTRRSVPRMSATAQQYEAEQFERQMRTARKAVKRAHTLVMEAERFLAS